MSIRGEVLQRIDESDCCDFVVAYSGGVDSSVLLHLLKHFCRANPALKLRAIYVNHHLSANADAWQQHGHNYCLEQGIEFSALSVDLNVTAGQSIEASARDKRYAALRAALRPGECLLLGHHQDDQAETLLLQLLRGSGPAGLAAMPASKTLDGYTVLRPMLNCSRAQIEAYASEQQLAFIEDDSNADTRFDRNFLRLELLPVLSKRWPQYAVCMARSAKHCAAANALLTGYAQQDWQQLVGASPDQLKSSALALLPLPRQQHAVRYWIVDNGAPLPDTQQLNEILSLLQVRNDASPCVHWKGFEVRLYQGILYIMPTLALHDSGAVISWDLHRDFILPDNRGIIAANRVRQCLGLVGDASHITLRYRLGGEKIRLHDRNCSHSLKKLLQEWNIPPWLRDRVPLIYYHDLLKVVVTANRYWY